MNLLTQRISHLLHLVCEESGAEHLKVNTQMSVENVWILLKLIPSPSVSPFHCFSADRMTP